VLFSSCSCFVAFVTQKKTPQESTLVLVLVLVQLL
jgi:hypothetical protein